MKWNGQLPVTDRFQARIIAQAYIRNEMNATRMMEEIHPRELAHTSCATMGSTLLKESAVLYEIGAIMERKENNAARFLEKMWGWLDDETEGKEFNERRQTAARILAKGYISEKKSDVPRATPYVVDGLEQGLENLTGPNVVPEKKVM